MQFGSRRARTIAALLAAAAMIPMLACAPRKPARPELPEVAFAPLAEDEFAKFAAALPKFVSALKASGYRPGSDTNESVDQGLALIIGGMKKFPGVADSLAAAGTSWREFSGTMYKVMSAAAAIAIDMAIAGAKDDSLGDNDLQNKHLSKAGLFAAKVPQSNREFVVNHQKQLAPLTGLSSD